MSPQFRLRLRHLRSIVTNARASFGVFPRECSICGYHGRFLGLGLPAGIDAACPNCTAGGRQRQAALVLGRLHLVAGKSVLHVAPEYSLATWIKKNEPGRYISGDIQHEADVPLNIENMNFPDNEFDVLICMHILEHVDDRRAIKEMHRVLRPGGSALVMVPIVEGWELTYENPQITSERERLLHFGQEDHVRYYGQDFRERLRAHFSVTEFTASEPEVARYGLVRGEKVFLCKKDVS